MRYRRQYRVIKLDANGEPAPLQPAIRNIFNSADQLRLAMAEDIRITGARQRKRKELLAVLSRTVPSR